MRRVFLGIILQFSVQMTGVSVIQYYSPQIFAALGFTTARTLLFQVRILWDPVVVAVVGCFLMQLGGITEYQQCHCSLR